MNSTTEKQTANIIAQTFSKANSPNWLEKFTQRIKISNDTGCWEWIGKLNLDGYGVFYMVPTNKKEPPKQPLAHRVAWMLSHDWNSLLETQCISHNCGTRHCVNPEHLVFVKSLQELYEKSVADGYEVPKGTKHWKAQLTESNVIKIRQLAKQGYSHKVVGEMFGISRRHVSSICAFKAWKHVPMS